MIAEQTAQIAALQQELTHLRHTATQPDWERAEVERQLATLREQVQRLTVEREALAQRDAQIAQLQSQVDTLQRQIQHQTEELGAIAQKDAQIAALRQETDELWQQLQDYADQSAAIAQKDTQIANLQKETEELWQQLAEESQHTDTTAALAEKDRQIATLQEQVARLDEQWRSRPDPAPSLAAKDQQIVALQQQLGSVQHALQDARDRHTQDRAAYEAAATAQTQRLAELEQQLRTQTELERAIAQKDTQLATLQAQLTQPNPSPTANSTPTPPKTPTHPPTHPPTHSPSPQPSDTPPLDPAEVERHLKTHLGSTVWFCLDERSQKNLCSAALMEHQHRWMGEVDYSDVGDRYCRVIAREIIQPFFQALYDYLAEQNRPTDIGGISLENRKTYPFGFLPSLIVPQWETLQDTALQGATLPNEDDLYTTGMPGQLVGTGDRALIQHFLSTWEHPLATWLLDEADRAAAWIDQTHKLHTRIQQDETPLYRWQYDLLVQLIIGDEELWGILQAVYRGRR